MILGNGGHAQVLADYLETAGVEYECIIGDEPQPEAPLILGMSDVAVKKKLIELLGADRFAGVVGPQTYVSPRSVIGRAAQIMAGAIVHPNCRIGDFVLINTGAQIDHHADIGDHCFIGPGAVLCGGVTLGAECYIGAGAVIVPNVTLEPGTFVSAGTLVVGQDDMRKPRRLVRNGGAATGPVREVARTVTCRPARERHSADAQPIEIVVLPCDTEPAGADVS